MNDRLFERIPAAAQALLKTVSGAAQERGVELYIVGGFVRDLQLGHASSDFDLVVVGSAVQFARALRKDLGGDLLVHERFGTANWGIAAIKQELVKTLADTSGKRYSVDDLPELLDFVTARRESYAHPAALPEVKPADIETDLQRRDFSVNTFALRLSDARSEVLSVALAKEDLAAGLIRVLHDSSFIDDPTRIFRAVRYEQRLGFNIEPHTLGLLKAALPYIAELSGDRVRHELDHILLEDKRIAILARLDDLGVLSAVDQDLKWNLSMQAGQARLPQPLTDENLAYLVWLAYLSPENGLRIAERLQFTTDLTDAAVAASKLKREIADFVRAAPSQLVARLEGVPQLTIHAMVYVLEDAGQKELIERYLNEWAEMQAGTDGHILKDRGLEPGPRYKEILTTLRSAWLDGEVSTAEEEQSLLERLLND